MLSSSQTSEEVKEEKAGGKWYSFLELKNILSNNHSKIDYKVLLYIPNIVGYIRLLLVSAAFHHFSSPVAFLFLYSTSITLDAIDGSAARKFKQMSLFGAWFDVVIDNIGRGLLWTYLDPHFYMISAVEWLTFVCNHHLGPNWKKLLSSQSNEDGYEEQKPPTFVTRILSNNFRNFWGAWTVAGLHVLPVWIYAFQRRIFVLHLNFLPSWIPVAGLWILIIGRCMCLGVEFWCIASHISSLLTKRSLE